ncbi:MAG: hypothetical protein ACKV19_06805 [Verrucomicrobiales bacterium]
MMERFFDQNGEWLLYMGVASAVMFMASLIVIPILVIRMRADYFVDRESHQPALTGLHPALRWTLLIGKNVLGILLLLLGLSMLIGPGQGVITVLLSLSLLNFPGKRRLEIRLLRVPGMLAGINRLRRRAGRDPVLLPD